MNFEVKGNYEIYDKIIPEDYYWVTKILQDKNGTLIRLYSDKKVVDIQFGAIECICQSDDGNRFRSYGEIKEIREYEKKDFIGNPLFIVENSTFKEWCDFESCGLNLKRKHYAIITMDDFIDVYSFTGPEIIIKRRIKNPILKIKRIIRNIKKKHKKKKKEKQNRISNK